MGVPLNGLNELAKPFFIGIVIIVTIVSAIFVGAGIYIVGTFYSRKQSKDK